MKILPTFSIPLPLSWILGLILWFWNKIIIRSQVYLPVSLITSLIIKSWIISPTIFFAIFLLPILQFLCSMGVNKLSQPFILSWWTIQKCMTTSEWDEKVSPIQQSMLREDLNKKLEVIEKDYHSMKGLPHPHYGNTG